MNKTTILAKFDELLNNYSKSKEPREVLVPKINLFLSTSIDSLLKSVEEKCDEMKTKRDWFGNPDEKSVYNQALTDLKSSIKSLYE
jgi:hypothetical protein